MSSNKKQRLYQKMQDQFIQKQQQTDHERQIKLQKIKSQSVPLDKMNIEAHQQVYDQIKNQHQYDRINQGLNQITDLNLKNLYKNPILKKLKQQDQEVKEQQVKQLEDKRQLISKKDQYAQFVREVFKPQVIRTTQARSQDRNGQLKEQFQEEGRKVKLPKIKLGGFYELQELVKLADPDFQLKEDENIESDDEPDQIFKDQTKLNKDQSNIRLKGNFSKNTILKNERQQYSQQNLIKLVPMVQKQSQHQNINGKQNHSNKMKRNESDSSFDSNCSECQRHRAQKSQSTSQIRQRREHKKHPWERKAMQKEIMIKQSMRDESVKETQDINSKFLGALKAKLSIIDSFEL
ncbi:UNKNOWN [Stylonychia lemnae]|uniref:Uncharacterized protein n=1 Tax=Stylonychia lemnae TaxID=5949 RepID=A0A078A145_STYLE|nr:UNKNOWN [Stylonychia lemnae]|eukprot:CDW75961.1 UNKNOWN [Stylonychia lemnae]